MILINHTSLLRNPCYLTRMHSSRMRTACFSDSGGSHYIGLLPGQRPPWEEHGTKDRDPPGRNMRRGSMTENDIIQRPLPYGQTNTCENITLPQTSREVKILRNRADIESNGFNGSRKRKTQGVPRLFRLLNGVLYSYLYKVSLTCGKWSRILPIMHFCFPGFKGMGLIIPKLRLGQSVCPPWHHIVGLFRNM